jgi:predicted PurR-regulated permease PerM
MSQPIKIQSVWIPILALSGLTLFAYFASPILVPLVSALFFAFLLGPLVDWLRKLKLPHSLAVAVVMIFFLILFGFGLWWGATQLAQLGGNAPQYQAAVVKALTDFAARLPDWLLTYLPFLRDPAGWVPSFTPAETARVAQFAFRGLGSAASLLGSAFLIYFLTFFMLLDKESIQKKLTYFFGRENQATTATILQKISRSISGFLVVKAALSIGLGAVLTVGFLILQVPLPFLWGPLTAILNWIPYLGSFIALILTAIATLASHGISWQLPALVIFFSAMQTLEGNVFGPKMLETRVDLNPLAVLLSAIFWAWIWGFAGALLAVPITAAFKVFCDHVEALQPFGILLGGRKKS